MVQSLNYTEAEGNEGQTGSAVPRIVHVRALMRGLQEPFLHFALLKSDPLAILRQRPEMQAQAVSLQAVSLEEMYTAWEELFDDLSLEQIFFVCAWNSIVGASKQVIRSSGLVLSIATPGLMQRRWLTTYPTVHNDELVAWCEAIDMRESQADTIADIVLAEHNMLRLATCCPDRDGHKKM